MKLIENNRKVRAAGVDVKGLKKTPGHDGWFGRALFISTVRRSAAFKKT